MPTPAEREFAVYRRGELRELYLRFVRAGLRQQLDPDTGQPFSEETLRQVTSPGSSVWVRADATDLIAQGIQKRDEFLAQQLRIDRAGSSFLHEFHGRQWGESLLPASGGGGVITATGLPGTTWLGSTTLPDSFAAQARDEAGNTYQVIVTGTADATGRASLLLLGVDGGFATNLEAGEQVTWINPPPGSADVATVAADFTGGAPGEDDAAFASRLASRVRHKPGAGNNAQVRALSRAASAAVEDAFVYACALNAGSVLVSPVQKRGQTVGPLARIPGAAVLSAVSAVVVPPGSPFLSPAAFVVVVPPVAESCDLSLSLALRKGSSTGWADLEPFPPARPAPAVTGFVEGAVGINAVLSPTLFRIALDAAGLLPGGATELAGVSLMVWDVATSDFELLSAATVTDLGTGAYEIELVSAPSHTLAVGDVISPATGRALAIAQGVEAYFDSLGPGEVVDLATSALAVRAFRFPLPVQEYPSRAGVQVLNYVADALGEGGADFSLGAISASAPFIPFEPIDGPSLLTLGKLGVYNE